MSAEKHRREHLVRRVAFWGVLTLAAGVIGLIAWQMAHQTKTTKKQNVQQITMIKPLPPPPPKPPEEKPPEVKKEEVKIEEQKVEQPKDEPPQQQEAPGAQPASPRSRSSGGLARPGPDCAQGEQDALRRFRHWEEASRH